MARPKGLIRQILDARAQARRREEAELRRLHQLAMAEERKAAAEHHRRAKQAESAAKRAEAQRLREQNKAGRLAEQAARAAEQRQRADQRRREADERSRTQQAAAVRRAVEAAEDERKSSEAQFRTAAVAGKLDAFARLLLDRNRSAAAATLELDGALRHGGGQALVECLQRVLARSRYPEGMSCRVAARYEPNPRELLVEYEFPPQSVVPTVTAYRYGKAKGMQPVPRKDAETKELYGDLLARLTLRTLAEAFAATPPDAVTGIVFNGYVSTKDKATGQDVRPLLISINADRERFALVQLDEPQLDPVLCLRQHLNAIVSPHPYDLEPVRPVVSFDLSKYKFVDEMDVVAGLDSRPDLLHLKPVEFEHLIRQLFEKIGMKSWVTQASKDEGVDAVAVNGDPIVGGLCIIQAKRWSKIVGVESVHALAGVMEHKRAAKGVLVVTSWVGKASRDFAYANGRIEIIEGRHLKSLLKEHLNIDVLISLPTRPPGWSDADLT
ncbi:restriction endonuclease [Catellatospora methionotrophica]|uniref:restriction endonuclease n=1 Tax=Catellatospora methionotrophica TaxID=121620 RepID=UPI0033FFB11D